MRDRFVDEPIEMTEQRRYLVEGGDKVTDHNMLLAQVEHKRVHTLVRLCKLFQ